MSDVEAPAGGRPDAEANIQTNIDANRSAEIKEVSDKIEKVSAEIKEVSDKIEKVSDKIEKVSAEIKEVSAKIEEVSADIKEVSIKLQNTTLNEEERQRLTEERQRLIKKEADLMADKEKLRSRQTGLEGVLDGHLKEQSDLRSQLQELRGAGRRGDDGEGQAQSKVQKIDSGDPGVGGFAQLHEDIQGLKKQFDSVYSATRNASNLSVEDYQKLLHALNLQVRFESDIDIDEKSFVGFGESRNRYLEFFNRKTNREAFWDHRNEKEMLPDIAKFVRDLVPQSWKRNKIAVAPAKDDIRVTYDNLPFPLSGLNDVVAFVTFLCEHGYVLGLEAKKNLDITRNFHQAVAEWIMYSHQSIFPFTQVFTDMESGGFALYCTDKDDQGRRFIICKCLDTMDKVRAFIKNVFEKLPLDFAADKGGTIVAPPQLDNPPRWKFDLAPCGNNLGAKQALALCQRILEDPLEQDLSGFDSRNWSYFS